MEFRKIAVAFDGSADSVRAVMTARELAEKFGSEIVVVHVYAPPVMAYGWATGMPVTDWKGVEDAARKGAEEILARGVSATGGMGKARGELLEGSSIVQALADYSGANKVDLLVVGTRGMTGFKKLVMGSVSGGLASHAPCAVLVVR